MGGGGRGVGETGGFKVKEGGGGKNEEGWGGKDDGLNGKGRNGREDT